MFHTYFCRIFDTFEITISEDEIFLICSSVYKAGMAQVRTISELRMPLLVIPENWEPGCIL